MANDKRFVVKNGLTAQNVAFVDAIDSATNTITVSMINGDTLSFSGDAGQLFSITDSQTGTIFAVNDISGVPSIEVDDDGTIRLAETFGNVGIGTTTPDTKLHLSSNGSKFRITQDTSGGTFNGIEFEAYTGSINGGLIWNQATGEIRLDAQASYFPTIYSGGAERVRITTAGNVGIGTTSPATALDVSGTVTATAFSGPLTGNASTATALATARTISLGGDVSGSASFDGSANITITATVADDSHNHIISNVDGLQTALDAKAPLASPALTGTPTAPTAAAGTNTTQIATTAFVGTAISNLVDAAPTTLDTLNELAAALGDDPNFATTVTNSIATKLPLAGGTMTGSITFAAGQLFDGRDVSADGSKLDGIEAGATADQTASEILTAIKTVDGSGSGLDADLLDGVHGSSFLRSDTSDTQTSGSIAFGTTTIDPDSYTAYSGGFGTVADGSGWSARGLFIHGGGTGDAAAIAHSGSSLYFGIQDGTNANSMATYLQVSPARAVQFSGSSFSWNSNNVFHDGYHPNADTLTTARTISLGGDLSGSASFDGSANITITAAVADDSHNHSSSSGNFTVGGDLTVSGDEIIMAGSNNRTKYLVWSSDTYGIGMGAAYTFGGLNSYAMTFQMSNNDDRGFWWGDSSHTDAQGAMSLTTNGKLAVAHSVRVGYGETDTTIPGASYALDVNGAFAATTKSFVIDHPTKPGMKLRHGSLEGPEDGVYVRGRLKDSNVIQLPDYWTGLVDEDSITVQLTPIGGKADIWVDDIIDNTVIVGSDTKINCFYFIQATRKDVEKWDVEYSE